MVETVFVCPVCSKRYVSRQGLAGHMRWHKKDEYVRTTISVEKSQWLAFRAVCRKHGTTTCAVLRGFVDLTVEGDKQGIVTIPSQNPMIVQLNRVVLGAPRGRYSHVAAEKIAESCRSLVDTPVSVLECQLTSWYDKRGRKVRCDFFGDLIPVEKCRSCSRRRPLV